MIRSSKLITLIICLCFIALIASACGEKKDVYAENMTVLTVKEDVEITAEEETIAEDMTEAETTSAASTYTAADYAAAGVDELNSAPILMYHRVYDITSAEAEFVGGNVDEDGYNRTWDAFESDLEMYYRLGYRMIRLTDYLDGKVDVPFGYSPIMLTFDDGIRDVVLEYWDENGEPVFEEHCAIGVLEKIKKKYPDFNVTATFFLNKDLFHNGDDDVKILKWMVENGYDIGNHTWDHDNLSEDTEEQIAAQVGSIYELLEEIIPGQYVNIIALPYGIPADTTTDPKYGPLHSCTYNGVTYTTKATLLCSWTRENSPFHKSFDCTYIRRIRGYDNNGEDFDIEMNFDALENGLKYISDGNPDTIVIREEDKDWLGETYGLQVITY